MFAFISSFVMAIAMIVSMQEIAWAQCSQTKPITMYTEPGCPFCLAAERAFSAAGLLFHELPARANGYSAWPIIEIGPHEIAGFNINAITAALPSILECD